ncbi:MAG: hypothetical protein KGO02_14840, partial [Alphaproteobacteria bacterium]|nr:hypothetical protein [Alphaproteobacteria bacterium]
MILPLFISRKAKDYFMNCHKSLQSAWRPASMQRRSNKPGLHALLAMMIAIFLASGQVLAQSRSGLPNAPLALPAQTQNHPPTSTSALVAKDTATTN